MAEALNRSAWLYVLSHPCPRHAAKAGQPCWDLPVAMCSTRLTTTRKDTP